MYDLIIIGGGPAGIAAGVYAARKKIKTLLITERFGGQSLVAAEIQNWIGTKSISGLDLAKNLEDHLRAQKEIEIREGDAVSEVEKILEGFKVTAKSKKYFETKTILVASGGRRRKLGIPSEKELDGKGIAYCSTCDAPLFDGKIVAVVGAGNAGLETVRDLCCYAKKTYLMVRSDKVRGDPALFEEIKKDPNVEILYWAEPKEFLGEKLVTGLKYLDKKDNKIKELKLDGVFIEIGSVPNVEFLGDLVEKTQYDKIVASYETQQTSQEGIWAAGDVTNVIYAQNNIAAGDAIKAVLNIYDYLNKKK